MGKFATLGAALAFATTASFAQSAESLDALTEEQRDRQLLAAIRAAGYECDELLETMLAAADTPAWRVVCNDALVYLATSEQGRETLRIAPLPYTDPLIGGPPEQEPVPELPPAVPPGLER